MDILANSRARVAEPQTRVRGRNLSEQGVFSESTVPLTFGQDRGARIRLSNCIRQKKEAVEMDSSGEERDRLWQLQPSWDTPACKEPLLNWTKIRTRDTC